jgi:hypothetical protein
MILTIEDGVTTKTLETIKAHVDAVCKHRYQLPGIVVERGDFTCLDGEGSDDYDALILFSEIQEILIST